jgi:hypothetical protein
MAWQDFLRNNSDTMLQTGIGLIGGRTGSEQATMGLQGFSNGRKQSSTLKFLEQNAPELAQAVQAGAIEPGEAYKMHLQQMADASKPKNPWQAVGGSLHNFETGEWRSPPQQEGANQDEYFGQPIPMVDEKGNYTVGQFSKSGKIKAVDGANGYKILPPSDISNQRAYGTATGKGQGEAAMQIPGALQIAGQIDMQTKELADDPYLPNMLGPIDSRTPNFTTDAARVQSKIDQLQGGAFLAAREMLKGGGQITDYEGKKAEQAYARLSQAQSEADFKEALRDFNTYVQQGAQKLQAQAAGAAAAGPMSGGQKVRVYNPATGALE